MTEFMLIRHGQTDWNIERRIQGQSDIPLSANGLAQARALALSLHGQQFDLVISSDLQRSAQTAQIIASNLSLPVQFEERLREVNHGKWEGMLISDLHEKYGDEYKAFRSDPVSSRAPDGESLSEAVTRILAVIEETAARYPSGRIMIISHGLILALLRCQINGLPLDQAHRFALDNCVSDLVYWPALPNEQS